MVKTDEHNHYRVVPTRRNGMIRSTAVCECGWASTPMTTAGLAGAAWDAHAEGAKADDR